MVTDYKKQGKQNTAKGKYFEDRVYADLEKKGWVCCRWMKNVELQKENSKEVAGIPYKNGFIYGKLIPAKPKIRMMNTNFGFKAIMLNAWTGFPDFIAYKECFLDGQGSHYEIVGVECKTNGKLTREEKEKCQWLLETKVFPKILIASKGTKQGKIIYNEFQR